MTLVLLSFVGRSSLELLQGIKGWGGEGGCLGRENSELYYSRMKILGSCLFLQSVPANLHASKLHIKQ